MPRKKQPNDEQPKKKPRKKPTGAARAARDKGLKMGPAAQRAYREAEAKVLTGAITLSPLPPKANVVEALRTGSVQMLLTLPLEDHLLQLVDVLTGAEAADDSWNDVLIKAGIPWLAWSMIRDTDEIARSLFTSWKRRTAERLAQEAVEISDQVVPILFDAGEGQRLRVATRRWVAERLDPETYGDKKQSLIQKNVDITRKVTIEIVGDT